MQPTHLGPAPASRERSGNRFWVWFGVMMAMTGSTALAQTPTPAPKTINDLKAFYQQNCVRCHGVDGSAQGPEGKKLGGQDFTKAAQEFRALTGPASEREIRAMIRTIQKGLLFGISMPAWKDQLSDGDATLMVKEVLLKAERGQAIRPEPITSSSN
jgi:mono/diheme cytochrome c family protein